MYKLFCFSMYVISNSLRHTHTLCARERVSYCRPTRFRMVLHTCSCWSLGPQCSRGRTAFSSRSSTASVHIQRSFRQCLPVRQACALSCTPLASRKAMHRFTRTTTSSLCPSRRRPLSSLTRRSATAWSRCAQSSRTRRSRRTTT